MSKNPDVSVRKPPEDKTTDIEQFISGKDGDDETSERSNTKTPERSNEKRRTTIHFDAEVSRKLRIYCAAEDKELSQVTSKAVAEFLSNKDFP